MSSKDLKHLEKERCTGAREKKVFLDFVITMGLKAFLDLRGIEGTIPNDFCFFCFCAVYMQHQCIVFVMYYWI